MSAGRHAAAFYREVAASHEVFLVEHEQDGPMSWRLAGDHHARPVWSSRRRAVAMLEGPLARSGLVVVRRAWSAFCAEDATLIERDGLLVGVNWAGSRARGYNLPASDVIAAVEALMSGGGARRAG